METLMKELNNLLEEKNMEIYLLKSKNERLTEEIKELKNDIEKYKENEVNANE